MRNEGVEFIPVGAKRQLVQLVPSLCLERSPGGSASLPTK
jgi:hypothetical protein